LAENASFDVLIDKVRPAVFAVGDDKKVKGKKEKVNKVARRYISAICGADTPGLISIKYGLRVARDDVIKRSKF